MVYGGLTTIQSNSAAMSGIFGSYQCQLVVMYSYMECVLPIRCLPECF